MIFETNLAISSSYMTNALALILLIVLFFANIRSLRSKRYYNGVLLSLLFIAFFTIILETISFYVNEKEGMVFYYLGMAVNTLDFIAPTLFASLLSLFVRYYFFSKPRKVSIFILSLPFLINVVMVIVNIFIPFLFKIDSGNTYTRLWGYYITLALSFLYIVYSLTVYIVALVKKKSSRFFPFYLFIFPTILGTILQSLFYGISMIWPCIAVGLAGVLSSVAMERVFTDELTDTYNRAYFNYSINNITNKKDPSVTGIMLDINDFKNINDKYGHDAGDKALKEFAEILHKAVGRKGTVIRLSGDEFVILVNTRNVKEIKTYIEQINHEFEKYNNSDECEIELFASLGYASYIKGQSAAEFLKNFDTEMYIEKERYHRGH